MTAAASAGGVRQVMILEIEVGVFAICAEIEHTGARYLLATRRKPNEPRRFKRLEVAARIAARFFDAHRMLIDLLPTHGDAAELGSDNQS